LAVAAAPAPGRWPWPTFAVNIAGALLLGYLITRLQERLPLSAYRRPLLGTGLCGALTTFSTMPVEVVRMLEAHQGWLALRVCPGQRRWGLAGGAAGHRLGAPGPGTAVTVLIWVGVALLGGLGAVARWSLDGLVSA
jgi:fluoride ion exporter CrcB/FEX